MKNSIVKILLLSSCTFSIYSCNKEGSYDYKNETSALSSDSSAVFDSVSSVATLQVKDKQFIKTAEVNMEVKDVYEATIAVEKTLKNLGGFVTSSRLSSNIVSEDTFNTSEENATLVRKFQTENTMQVRVPTEKLGDFLTLINNQKIFLHSRNILAEDVTANIKLAELEAKRNSKIAGKIEKIDKNKESVILANENELEGNYQKMASFQISDQIKYSNVDLFIKEPKVRVAEIAVTNTTYIDHKYKSNFFYEAKNSLIEGFYLIQKIVLRLLQIWPLIIIGAIVFYFLKKRKTVLDASEKAASERKD